MLGSCLGSCWDYTGIMLGGALGSSFVRSGTEPKGMPSGMRVCVRACQRAWCGSGRQASYFLCFTTVRARYAVNKPCTTTQSLDALIFNTFFEFSFRSAQVDQNGDGRIDYEEFCAMMRATDLDVLKSAHEVRGSGSLRGF